MFPRGGGSVDRRKFIREALPVLTFLGTIEVFTGYVLSGAGLKAIPGLLAVVPALISLRGNVSGSFASRLGSMAHLGIFDPEKPFKTAKEGVKAVVFMSVAFSVLAGIFASLILYGTGHDVDFVGIIFVVSMTALLSSLLLSTLSILSVSISFRRKIDPDNVVVPIISTVGDLMSVAIMAFFIWLWGVVL